MYKVALPLSILLALISLEAKAQVNINTRVDTNFARPDERDRVGGAVELSGDGLGDATLSLGTQAFVNPDVQVTSVGVRYGLTDRLSITAGADATHRGTVPSASVGYTAIFSEDFSLYLAASRGLVTDDPRAVEALLQSNEISASFWANDVSAWGKLGFISDGNEVFEGGLSVNTNQEWLAFSGYGRAATEDSDLYWSPQPFYTLSADFRAKLSEECGAGVRVGVAVNESDPELAIPVGAFCDFDWGRVLVGYGYGATATVEANFSF